MPSRSRPGSQCSRNSDRGTATGRNSLYTGTVRMIRSTRAREDQNGCARSPSGSGEIPGHAERERLARVGKSDREVDGPVRLDVAVLLGEVGTPVSNLVAVEAVCLRAVWPG